jgi:hypothetical protein
MLYAHGQVWHMKTKYGDALLMTWLREVATVDDEHRAGDAVWTLKGMHDD